MVKRRRIIVIAVATLFAAVAGIYLSIDSAQATDKRSVVSSDMRDVVSASVGSPHSPISANAANEITHLHTPADPALPGLFSVPTTPGGACIVTSDAVISSCLQKESPGTVTVRDDSTGDNVPPFVYGLVRPSVVAVLVSVGGVKQPAMLGQGFYLLKLESAKAGVEAIESVSFTLQGGKTVVRSVTG